MKNSIEKESKNQFVDHPAPSFFLVIAISLVLILGLLVVPFGFYLIGRVPLINVIFILVCAFFALIYIGFTMLALGTTRYRLEANGLDIRFGIWHRFFTWDNFNGFLLHKGFFAYKIFSPGITPCIRLNNAVVLKMKNGSSIYLTPKDIPQFLNKLAGFIPTTDNSSNS